MSSNRTALSPFQREKLEYYFNFFDSDGNQALEMEDLGLFQKRILKFTGWTPNSNQANECREIHEVFFEILKEKADQNANGKIELCEWLSMWEHILPGCMGMHNFPVWLRLLPKSLFRIIDKNADGIIDAVELADFYEHIIGIKSENARRLAITALDSMTDFNNYPLDIDGYEQVFANFLLGKTPYGPGRFIFGCFEHKLTSTKFTLIQNAPADDEDSSVISSNRNRRGSDPPRFRVKLR